MQIGLKQGIFFGFFQPVYRTVFVTILFFLLGYSFFWSMDSRNLPIQSVEFIGEADHLSEATLHGLLTQALNAGFLKLKLSDLRQQLLSLTWMHKVTIRRVWPNHLVVRFEEHTPFARWGKTGIMSTTGVLFYPQEDKAAFLTLPLLEGPQGRESLVWQQYWLMEQILSPLGLHITHLTLALRGAWQLRLSNEMTVVLGTNDVLGRLTRFVRFYEKCFSDASKRIAYVDLRYTNGMAVGWLT